MTEQCWMSLLAELNEGIEKHAAMCGLQNFWTQVAIAALIAEYDEAVRIGIPAAAYMNRNLWQNTLEFFWAQIAIAALLQWTKRYGWIPEDGFDQEQMNSCGKEELHRCPPE